MILFGLCVALLKNVNFKTNCLHKWEIKIFLINFNFQRLATLIMIESEIEFIHFSQAH